MNAVISDWPSGSTNQGWPQEPTGMLMPGRVQGWPAGTQRAANAAERLLSQAVAWWDVEQYRDGDRFLRNRGTAGELLDLRLGSAAVANSNDPQYLGVERLGYAYFPGSGTNRLQVTNAIALNVTGNLDLRLCLALDDWTPTADMIIASKYGGAGQRSWYLRVQTDGKLFFQWSNDGTNTLSVVSTVAPTVADGAPLWVRVTLTLNNGAGSNEVRFYTSNDGTAWTQLGTTITTAGTTSIFASTNDVFIGSANGSEFSAGKFYRAQLLDGIDGTTVLDIDCDAITSGSATSFTALTNQTVTVNRSTSGRKSVCVPSRHKGGKPVMALGTDDFLAIPDENGWQHGLLNFAQGDSFTVLAVLRRWDQMNSAAVPVVGKMVSSGAGNTWALRSAANSLGSNAWLRGTDQTIFQPQGGTVTTGTVASLALVVNRATATGTIYTNGTAGTAVNIAGNSNMSDTNTLRIGQYSTNINDAQLEFYATAIFRRALSPAEITALSNYFTGRIA